MRPQPQHGKTKVNVSGKKKVYGDGPNNERKVSLCGMITSPKIRMDRRWISTGIVISLSSRNGTRGLAERR
jgi:hypothetical protein